MVFSGGKMPMKNGKPDPVWMAIFLIGSSSFVLFFTWSTTRSKLIVLISLVLWIWLVLKAKYD